jgi:nitrate reductase NapE
VIFVAREAKVQLEPALTGVEHMDKSTGRSSQKGKETRLFLFLVICLFPLLSIALVGGYGFFIWFMQMLLGPPGPPT